MLKKKNVSYFSISSACIWNLFLMKLRMSKLVINNFYLKLDNDLISFSLFQIKKLIQCLRETN
jgi:hypothetical protein